jgi:hypothetical protein
MKKAFYAIAIVGAYSLLETALLFGGIQPLRREMYLHQMAWLICQIFCIAGLAILFSRIMYGSHKFPQRALLTLGSGIQVLFCLWISLLLVINRLVPSHSWLALPLFLVLAGLAFVLVRAAIGKVAKWNVEAEAVRYLAERRRGTSSAKRSRTRGILIALWIPVLMVTFTFFFLPEIWAIISHITFTRSGDLDQYRARIPWNVITLYHSQHPDGSAETIGLVGHKMRFSVHPFQLVQPMYSSWSLWVDTSDQTIIRHLPAPSRILGTRDFKIGTETITCLDYWPLRMAEEPRFAYVNCYGVSRFRVEFSGQRSDLPAFYQMLANTAISH